ncbi:MAG: glutamate-cysteine ligase family protein, partial [Deltaproteobacteria bacterium]|nr:glutamate-cysteine ligase family protein [Deltaproteobacteria bacterium]
MTTLLFSDASPPLESFDQLIDYFKKGETPRHLWKIGAEHEKTGLYTATRQPVPFGGDSGIRAVLQGLQDRFGWSPILEGEELISLAREGAMITLEPGGQLELSGAQWDDSHQILAEVERHIREVKEVSGPLGITWLALGHNPLTPVSQIPWMPKERYRLMRDYLPTQGEMALDMMLATSSIQVSLDYRDESDMVRKIQTAYSMAPVLAALSANSPFAAGRPAGHQSIRQVIWQHMDPDRCGIPPQVFAGDFGYQEYARYALDVPMFFIHRDGRHINLAGTRFKDYFEHGAEGQRATQEDWLVHLTTLFPEVRLKTYLELRMMDAGPPAAVAAFSALARSVLYDDTALEDTRILCRGMDSINFPHAMTQAATNGLQGMVSGRPLLETARDLLEIARRGADRLAALNTLGKSESALLAPLEETIRLGISPAARLLQLYNGPWGQKLDGLFQGE